MSVYKRYFRITAGPIVEEIRRLFELRSAAGKLYAALGEKYGAAQVNNYERSGQFAGFVFKEKPDTDVYRFLKKDRMWVPRKRGPGAEIWKEIESLPRPEPIENAIKLVGLTPGLPSLMDGGRWYAPTLWGFDEPTPVWFVSVPWMEVDPEKLAAYQLERASNASSRCNSNFEHLAWRAPTDWTEVKGWEIEKECEEINAAEAARGAE